MQPVCGRKGREVNKSKLLFAVHEGRRFGRAVGALSLGVWPLAISDTSDPPRPYEEIDGFWSLWQAVASVEDFGMCAFGGSDLDGAGPGANNGLWVYEVEFEDPGNPDEDQDCSDPEMWTHLHRGEFRRPHHEELRQVCDSPDPVSAERAWQVVL